MAVTAVTVTAVGGDSYSSSGGRKGADGLMGSGGAFRCPSVFMDFPDSDLLGNAFPGTNSGNTSDLFPMSPRTLDSLMHNEGDANPGHLDSITLEMELSSDVASPM
ncbi:hypothetical protein CRUP_031045 [Coryphaenoides rupestris]|nr:hypothetical protein CRUP_031045 [Coryphaenoides rupestris]